MNDKANPTDRESAMTESEKQAAITAAQTKVDEALKALPGLIAALTEAHVSVVVEPTPLPVPEIPNSLYPFAVRVISANPDKTIEVVADLSIIKDKTTLQFSNGRKSHVVAVQLNGSNMTVTTSEAAADSSAGLVNLVGTTATVRDRYVTAPATPVVTPPVVETPVVTTPVVTTPSTGTAGLLPMVGVNMSGLGNNPYVENAVSGRHFREPDQKYFDKYGPCLYRLPISPERAVAGWDAYMVMIKSALDKVQKVGGKAFIDPHCYMRLYTTVAADAPNPYGYDDKSYANGNGSGQTVRKLWIPIGAPGCLMTEAEYAAFLKKLSADVSTHPACIGVGIANEPFSRSQDPFNVVTRYLANVQMYFDAIASASDNFKAFVGGGEYCTALNWVQVSDTLRLIKDPKKQAIFEAHQYLDGNMYGGGGWSNRNEVIPVGNGIAMVKGFVEWLIKYGLTGILAEHGHPAENLTASAATALMLPYLIANGVMSTQWCAGPGWPANDVNGMDTDDLTYKANADAIKPFLKVTTTAYGKPGA